MRINEAGHIELTTRGETMATIQEHVDAIQAEAIGIATGCERRDSAAIGLLVGALIDRDVAREDRDFAHMQRDKLYEQLEATRAELRVMRNKWAWERDKYAAIRSL